MAMRLVQIVLPRRHDVELRGVFAERPAGTTWVDEISGELLQGWALVRTGEAEAFADKLVDLFGSFEGFRIVKLPVETAIPRLDEPTPEPAPEDSDASVAKVSSRVSREELLDDIEGATKVDKIYLALVGLSALVAAIGLVRDNVAVVIGAMVIAPLLGPNIALSLATTLGHDSLFKRALRANVVGVGLALGLAVLLPLFLTVDPSVSEIDSRTRVGLGDLALALASGAAGALVFTTGAPTALVGVMVAVALMPPTVAVGLLAGSGEFSAAIGAGTLLAANVICVNLAGVVMFLLQGVRPQNWWEQDKARRATRKAIAAWGTLLGVLVLILLLGPDQSA